MFCRGNVQHPTYLTLLDHLFQQIQPFENHLDHVSIHLKWKTATEIKEFTYIYFYLTNIKEFVEENDNFSFQIALYVTENYPPRF